MKKIILIFVLMFSFILVNAEEQVEVKLEWVPNVYYNYDKDGLNYWGQFAYIYVGDKIGYCLDISTSINSSIYTKSEEVQTKNLVILAGYFGYGYNDNTSLKDYMATQALIWEYLGTDVHFTTQSNGQGDVIDIFENKLKIVYMINNHVTYPTYNHDFKFNVGSTYNLEKENKTISQFKILNDTPNNIEFTDTGLKFTANKLGKNAFYIQSTYVKNYDNTIYVSDNSQKVMVIGEIENPLREYLYEVFGGSMDVNVILNNNGKDSGGLVTDNVFELYDSNDAFLGTYSPNEDGHIFIDNLDLGNYKLKHKIISDGYVKEVDEYEYFITKDELNLKKEIVLNLKKVYVTINKTFGNPIANTLYYDDGVTYKIYDGNDNFINEVVTDLEGKVNFTLEYGEYKIKEMPSNKIDTIHDDIIINKSDFEENITYNIYDKLYESRIKLIVLDKNDNNPIANLNFKLNDNEYITDDEGIYVTEPLSFGIYNFSNIVIDGYKNVDDFQYELSGNSNFYVSNNEVFVDIILYMEKLPEQGNDEVPGNENTKEDLDVIENDVDSGENAEETFVDKNDEEQKKLPFLGVNLDEENFVNKFDFVYYFTKSIGMYKLQLR